MTDSSPEREQTPDTGPPADTPRWVKVLGILVLLLVLLVAVLHLTGSSVGGPGSHLGSAGTALLP